MAITATAQRNHDALFPDHPSTLKATDPEVVEIFDNRAFDDVIQDAPIEIKEIVYQAVPYTGMDQRPSH
jgi:4-carboxymuconolactone decarboxylase